MVVVKRQSDSLFSRGRLLDEEKINSAKLSFLIKEGFTVVIIGKPNVGKSSLINTLTRLETSIVSDTPGTTRDIIQQKIDLKGLPVIFYVVE